MSGKGSNGFPRLYHEFAEWFHLLTAPEDYRDEAAFYRHVIVENSRILVKEVLELGSGGGNDASHLKTQFSMTLTDISEEMLDISRKINPECEHIVGDMRNMRLGRQFDAVFVHDAVSYMNTELDLAKVIGTAFIHCRRGGISLFCPDYVRETFKTGTQHGGHDSGNRAMRYLEWTRDLDPDDTSYVVDFAYLFRVGESVSSKYERHTLGLFAENDWYRLLAEAGFGDVKKISYPAGLKWLTPVFIGIKPQ